MNQKVTCANQPLSTSLQSIINKNSMLESDRITKYASSNCYDIRTTPCSFLDSRTFYK